MSFLPPVNAPADAYVYCITVMKKQAGAKVLTIEFISNLRGALDKPGSSP
jgi:hypothetical protein